MRQSLLRTLAFCDQYRQSHGQPPTLPELINAVGWVPVELVKRLATRGQVQGVRASDEPEIRLFNPSK